jgi:hypothetical protein
MHDRLRLLLVDDDPNETEMYAVALRELVGDLADKRDAQLALLDTQRELVARSQQIIERAQRAKRRAEALRDRLRRRHEGDDAPTS